MAETVKDTNLRYSTEGEDGIIRIADDVVSGIIGLAVTEVDGVSKLTGDITRDIISRLGKNKLSNGIKVEYFEEGLKVDVSVEVRFGFNILEVSRGIQEKVKQSLLTMTGLVCSEVNVRVTGIDLND